MALLEDPTIQRILDEVNKAAAGGIFGVAGNYIPEPINVRNQPPAKKIDPYQTVPQHHQQQQQQEPMFYPTTDMFPGADLTSFDPNINLNAMVSMAEPSSFDLYADGLYDTMPGNVISPYDSYGKPEVTFNHTHFHHHQPQQHTVNQMRTTSMVSSTNNDVLSEPHRHLEYPTIPPKITAAVPNLGLNLRATPQLESMPSKTNNDISASEIPTEPITTINTDIATASIDLVADKDDVHSLPPNDNEEMAPPHLSSAGRIFYDPNPQIIQRKGSNSVTYKQNVIVRFLQPPPIQNPGPLVIKEVSTQQQSPLPPLVIKQRPTPPKTPPPIVIREKPPPLPASAATKVITRHLPPEPAPPRAVIIERLPPLPPKPRDIIIERWLPYEIVNQKRKVVVERVQKTSKEHPQPKNVIITYEPVHAKIERHFQTQNVVREDPQEYLKRFGEHLYDTEEVFRQARAMGVLEDLNPPAGYVRNHNYAMETNNVAVGTDYDLPTKSVDEHSVHEEETPIETTEKIEEEVEQQLQPQQQEAEILPPVTRSSVEVVQEEDILVEENVTPFYINSGENLEETLQRLGIDFPKHMLNEQTF